MKLSSPIHVLKSQAKELKKKNAVSMSEALNLIAKQEGFNSWSLLQSKSSDNLPNSYAEILDYFNNGDLAIIGARPNRGKTSFTIGLFVQAIQQSRGKNYYFTLSEVHRDVAGRIAIYDESIGQNNNFFELDYSNDISADYIINKTSPDISEGSLIIVDYLQLLDEKRTNPPLQEQIEKLKQYAKEMNCIIIFISQLQREIENRAKKVPTVEDIRLPNPLDLKLINKIILLYREAKDSTRVDVMYYRPKEYNLSVNWNKEKIQFS